MKKLILSLFLSIIGFIGFSNAVDINLTCEGQGDCIPIPFYTFEKSYNNLCFNFSTPVHGEIYNDDNSLSLIIAGESSVCGDIPSGGVNFYHGNNSVENFVVSFILPGEGGEGGEGGPGGNTGGLVVGGISEFTPIITGLKSAIIEFIPYVVYVGVGLISAILGFFAVKWLINWTRRKTLTNFTSRRLRK